MRYPHSCLGHVYPKHEDSLQQKKTHNFDKNRLHVQLIPTILPINVITTLRKSSDSYYFICQTAVSHGYREISLNLRTETPRVIYTAT